MWISLPRSACVSSKPPTSCRLPMSNRGVEEQPAAEGQSAVEAAEEQSAVEAADESAEEEQDPAVALKADLATRPGEGYVVHSYAGYENKVKANLETRVQNLDVGDYIFQVEGPTE